ncbi:MAG: TonB-dependent receptor plug domain-containing protein, partial [Thermodesulfovibrionales bacterium]
MSVKVWGPYFFLIFLLVPSVGIASEDNKISRIDETRSVVIAQSKEAVEDLLMFWEEKDLFVQTATRNEKRISQAAENITVITAKEIEDMNVHTVAEVLSRVTGVFVDPQGGDFGSAALVFIQSSEHKTDMSRHTLVLLDGVIWNTGGANAAVNIIPLGIIKRIEIIKGPASSAWGSSLGGVINIITKDAGDTKRPSGTLSASYGEVSSQDYNSGVFGKAGGLGYYLFAGRQRSDGLGGINRDFDKDSFYSKFSLPVSKDVKLGFSAGYNDSDWNGGDYLTNDVNTKMLIRDFFVTASLDAVLTNNLKLSLSLYSFEEKFYRDDTVLGLGNYDIPPVYGEEAGQDFSELTNKNESIGGSAKLIWSQGMHTVILGADL